MFTPNTVGTPNIYFPANHTQVLTPFTLTPGNFFESNVWFNVINAAPALDFQHTSLLWNGTPIPVAANGKWALVQQFNITRPVQGNAVGIEVMAAIELQATPGVALTPILFKMTAALGTTLAGALSPSAPTTIEQPRAGVTTTTELANRTHYYRTQVVVKDDPATIAGTYAHGFAITDLDQDAAGYSIGYFRINAAIRQYSDQQNIGYRRVRQG